MNIEVGKKYKTHDGFVVRVICTDMVGEYPVVALKDVGGQEKLCYYTNDGLCGASSSSFTGNIVSEYYPPLSLTILVDTQDRIIGQEVPGGDNLFYGGYKDGYRRVKMKEVE